MTLCFAWSMQSSGSDIESNLEVGQSLVFVWMILKNTENNIYFVWVALGKAIEDSSFVEV